MNWLNSGIEAIREQAGIVRSVESHVVSNVKGHFPGRKDDAVHGIDVARFNVIPGVGRRLGPIHLPVVTIRNIIPELNRTDGGYGCAPLRCVWHDVYIGTQTVGRRIVLVNGHRASIQIIGRVVMRVNAHIISVAVQINRCGCLRRRESR